MEENVPYLNALRIVEKVLVAVHKLDGKLPNPSVLGLTICGEIAHLSSEKAKEQVIYVHLERQIEGATLWHHLTLIERFDLIKECVDAAIKFRDFINPP